MNTVLFQITGTALFFLILITAIALLLRLPPKTWASGPQRERKAHVIAKRQEITSGGHYTAYYVTFEFETGERQEYAVKGSTFGLLIEKDKGILTTRADAYIEFERHF